MMSDMPSLYHLFPVDDSTMGSYPIRDIFQQFYPSYLDLHSVTDVQHRTPNCIANCKTGGFGYNSSYCEECGHLSVHACACNNRSCPNYQSSLEQKWIMTKNSELIEGVAYYHLVFTVPSERNHLMYANQKLLYDLLFKCASDTILMLYKDSKYMGTLKQYWNRGKLLFDGSCAELRNRFSWKEFVNRMYEKQWLPFVKETFNGNGNAIEYLARYAYRTAISNSRITAVEDGTVSFRYTDYADGSKKKVKTVSGAEFIRLFLQHILPKGFNRVRFSGFLTNSQKTKKLKLIHRLRNTVYQENPVKRLDTADLMMLLFQRDICHCSICQGNLIRYPRGVPLVSITIVIVSN